jgi:hypothetical protein
MTAEIAEIAEIGPWKQEINESHTALERAFMTHK